MTVATLMRMLVMFRIVNVLVLVDFSIMVMGMDMLFCGMATHMNSPPAYYCSLIPLV